MKTHRKNREMVLMFSAEDFFAGKKDARLGDRGWAKKV